MFLRIHSFIMDRKQHRQSLLMGVMVALVFLLACAAAFPTGGFQFEADDDPGDAASFALTAGVSSAAIHLPALASRPGHRRHERMHLMVRRARRNSVDRGPDPGLGIPAAVIVFLHLILEFLLALRREAAISRAEFLTSHIGEKRFGDGRSASAALFSLRVHSVTVLHAAPSLFYSFGGSCRPPVRR